jgi:hypothetical protein
MARIELGLEAMAASVTAFLVEVPCTSIFAKLPTSAFSER